MCKKVSKSICLILAILTIVVFFTSCGNEKNNESSQGNKPVEIGSSFGRNKIDLSKYITVSFESFNGYGKVDISEDIYDIVNAVDQIKMKEYITALDPQFAAEYYAFGDRVTLYELFDFIPRESYTRLSNGDKVIVDVVVDPMVSDYNLTLESISKDLEISFDTVFEYTVSGLKEGTAIDILSQLEKYIVYNGANGGAYASMEIPEDFSAEINGFYLTETYGTLSLIKDNVSVLNFHVRVEPNKNVGEGDIIKIKMDDFNYLLEPYNAFFAELERDVMVPDLGDYITTSEQLTQAQISEIETAVYNHYVADNEFAEKIEMLGIYTGTLKPTEILETNSPFVLMYTVKTSEPDFWYGGYYERYFSHYIYDIIKNPDGTISYEIGGYYYADFGNNTELESYISDSGKYNFVKIK